MPSCQLAVLIIMASVSIGKVAVGFQNLVLKPSHHLSDRYRIDEHNLNHVFKERMPQLEMRTDITKMNRVDLDHLHKVVFVIRQKNMIELIRILHDVSDPASENYGHHLTRDEVAGLTSNPESHDALGLYLLSEGVRIVAETKGGEYVTGEAPIEIWERMFNTAFFVYHQRQKNGSIKEVVRAEMYSIPRELDAHVESVLNTVEMPQIRRGGQLTGKTSNTDMRLASYPGAVTPQKLKAYYNMSKSVGNSRSTQAIFAAGDQNFSPIDLKKYQIDQKLVIQSAMNISGHANHTVCVVDPSHCGESNLDIQWIMATSQGSPTTHWHTDDYFNDWLTIVANTIDPPLILSISYGSEERYVSDSVHEAFTTQAIKCGTMGVTILVSSGDDGVLSNTVRGKRVDRCKYQPDFPAANPYVTAVGATSGVEKNQKEVVCQANRGQAITSGGGFSNYYPQPYWQASAVSNYFTAVDTAGQNPQAGYNPAGRGYPDISLAGSMYLVYIGNQEQFLSGTSASTPAIAGFFSTINAARFDAGKGALGWLNPTLYAYSETFVNDITIGDNMCAADGTCCPQGFYASTGWDPTTGLGSVNFGKMQALFVALGNPVNGALIAPTAAPSDAPKQNVGISKTILIGSIIGSFVLITLFAISIFFFWKSFEKKVVTRKVFVAEFKTKLSIQIPNNDPAPRRTTILTAPICSLIEAVKPVRREVLL